MPSSFWFIVSNSALFCGLVHISEIRFPELDIRFIAINDGVDSENQSSDDFTPFRNIMNEWYTRDISKKVRAVIQAKGMSGKRLGSQTPYGYLKGKDGTLIVDEETAPVVRLIYELCSVGNGPGKIARILRERQINTPRTMDFLRTGRSDHYDPTDPFGWTSATIAGILEKREYLGHTVNFKTTRKSFKSKRIVHNPQEKQVMFENTHEPIVDVELWDVVQKIREQRHRPIRTGETGLFSGLVFCADCGSRLNLHRSTAKGKTRFSYICNKYRNSRGVQLCTAHYIRDDVLEDLVLDNLRKVIAYVQDYEDEFVQEIIGRSMNEQAKQLATTKRQFEQQTQRISKIDAIIQQLYEDNISGKLTDERFSRMCSTYEKEQKELEASTAELQKAMETCSSKETDVNSFLKVVRSYTEPERLTPEILRMFVEKIVLHEGDSSSGQRIQQVDIHYNFVGQINMSIETAKTRRKPGGICPTQSQGA